MFADQQVDEMVAVYTANFLLWRVAEKTVEHMTDKSQVINFLEMLNESNRGYMNEVLAGWRHTHTEGIR